MKVHNIHHSRNERARHVLRRTGYKGGGIIDKAGSQSMAADIEKAVHQHERHDHKGAAETKIKLKEGGHVGGRHVMKRLDKAARGGGQKQGNKPRKGHHSTNIMIAMPPPQKTPVPVPVGGGQHPVPLPTQGSAGVPPPAPAGKPMVPGAAVPGGGGPPVGGMPMPMHKRGGQVAPAVDMDAGSGGGEGRLEKIKAYGAKKGK